MSLTNLNEIPLHHIPLNKITIQSTFLVMGILIKLFLFLQILLHRKKISSFFLGFQPHVIKKSDPKPSDQDQDKRSVCMATVLKTLGLFNAGEVGPARMNADEIYEIFEERKPSLGEVKEAFEVFDSNGDGVIDEKELQKVLCALGFKEGFEMENCRRMIGVFDEDGDGRIDFDEFVKFMENSFA